MRIVEPVATHRAEAWWRAVWPELGAEPGELVALRLPLPVPEGTPYVANGWQSWSTPAVRRLGGLVERPRRTPRAGYRVAPRHLWSRPSYTAEPGDESYDVFVADGFVAGVTHGSAVFVGRPDRGDLLVVREADAAATATPHPDVWWAEGDADVLYPALLDHTNGRTRARTRTGWCSWYCYWEHVDELAMRRMLRRLQPHADALDTVIVDDGYQPEIGDWLDTSERFPSGLRALADSIRDAGFEPGLWCAPFVVTPASRLANERPEWLLRDATGAPVPAAHVDHWGGVAYALDVTRIDVQSWLAALANTLVEIGFTYLKIDFGYATALSGALARHATAEARTRRALLALRTGAGEDAYIAASGMPLWPALGLVDAMRVGPDVAPYFEPRPVAGIPDHFVASLANTWRAAQLRTPMHGRCWTNDPDCVLLRRRNTELTAQQRDGWADWVARSGQSLVLSDRTEDLDDADLERFEHLVHRHAHARTTAA